MDRTTMIGAAVACVAGGVFLAYSLETQPAEAKIGPVSVSAENNIVTLAEGDKTMAEARTAARATFDQFWTLVQGDTTGFDAISIKVGVPHENGSEHLWMTGCKSPDAESFECTVSNDPVDVPLVLGTRYTFDRELISDWMYRQDGKIHGGYSIRALMPTLPRQQADALVSMLAPLPDA